MKPQSLAGGPKCWGYWRKLQPFQERKRSRHQVRSRKNSKLGRIGWSSRRKAHSEIIMQRKKERPWGTTLQACWRWPISDSRSFHLHEHLWVHCFKRAVVLSNLSFGTRACKSSESSSIPVTVKHVEGHSNLSGWREMPSLEKQWMELSRSCWQTEEPDGPRVWKSSR